MSVSKAENDLDALSALRDRLAAEIDMSGSAQEIAVLSRQFLAVVAALAELRPMAPSKVDEIARKHQEKLALIRGAKAETKAPTRRKAQSGG